MRPIRAHGGSLATHVVENNVSDFARCLPARGTHSRTWGELSHARGGEWCLEFGARARGRAAKGAETCEKQVARPNAPRRA